MGRKIGRYLIPILLVLLADALIYLGHQGRLPLIGQFLTRLDYLFYDLGMQFWAEDNLAREEIQPLVSIVEVDEASLRAIGRWPWSRQQMQALTARLLDAGAILVAFDVIFAEPEPNPALQLLQQLPPAPEQQRWRDQLGQWQARHDYDRQFGEFLAENPGAVVLGTLLHHADLEGVGWLGPPLLRLDETPVLARLPNYRSYSGVLPEIGTGSATGVVLAPPDLDGVVRRVPLLFRHQEAFYPSLALQAALLFQFETGIGLKTEQLPWIGDSLQGIWVGKRLIPTDTNANTLIPFFGPARSYFPYLSAARILLKDDWQDQVQGRIVLVGATALGLEDLRATPIGASFPGVEVHANLIEAMINDAQELEQSGGASGVVSMRHANFRSTPAEAEGAVNLALLALAPLSLICLRLGPVGIGLGFVALTSGLIWLYGFLFSRHYLLFPLAPLLVLTLLLTLIYLLHRFWAEQQQRKIYREMFGQYVPAGHIDDLLQSGKGLAQMLAGETRELTVLFCDIRNFTTISESMSATELKQMLNDFFTPMTGQIFHNRGTIDKYVGDMIMAFWGAPMADPDHASHAIGAALCMLETLESLQPQFAAKGYPPIGIGIGLNSGPMNVGDMGSEFRRAYTVLGDAVNLGSRLEGLTKAYGVSLLIGEETFKAQRGYVCRRLDRVKVKGKAQAIQVYEPIAAEASISAELRQEIECHHQALDAYLARQWDCARAGFEALWQQHGRSMYRLYLERIQTLCQLELPADWDGVYVRQEK